MESFLYSSRVIMGRAPRLAGFDYRGCYVYFLTICTFERVRWFADSECAREATTQLLRTSKDYSFELTAYCFMPDHLHALLGGLRADSDFRRFAAMFKQRSGFDHLGRRAGRLWQEGYFERTLREDEDVERTAAYILANPLRAGLCDVFGEYPHLGSSRYTIEQLREAVQTPSS
jgi:putative transposase